MKVGILLGSVRQGRQSHKVAEYLAAQLQARGLDVDLIDLAEAQLPILQDRGGYSLEDKALVAAVGKRLKEADSLIFVSPEYHGSFSGVLKNALDYYWSEFSKKPIGVATVSSGRMGGINASTQLQHVILSLGAFPVPVKLLVSEVEQAFGDAAEPSQEGLKKLTTRFLEEFLWFAEAVYEKKSQQLLPQVHRV